MPFFGPISRRELIRALRKAGFEGQFSGSKHQFMKKGDNLLRIPTSHRGDIDVGLLNRLLKQAGISREEWEQL